MTFSCTALTSNKINKYNRRRKQKSGRIYSPRRPSAHRQQAGERRVDVSVFAIQMFLPLWGRRVSERLHRGNIRTDTRQETVRWSVTERARGVFVLKVTLLREEKQQPPETSSRTRTRPAVERVHLTNAIFNGGCLASTIAHIGPSIPMATDADLLHEDPLCFELQII